MMGIGGGIITKKLLFTVFLIASLSLSGISTASAAEQGTVATQDINSSSVKKNVNKQTYNANIVNKTAKTQNTADNNIKTEKKVDSATVTKSTTQSSEDQTQAVTKDTTTTNTTQATTASSISQNTEDVQSNTPNTITTNQSTVNEISNDNASNYSANTTEEAAAGDTVSTTQTATSFTVTEIKDAASRVKAFIEANHKLPNYVTIGTTQVVMPDFLKLLSAGLLQLNSGTNNPIALKSYSDPTNIIDDIMTGNMQKAEYLHIANDVMNYMDSTGKTPDYAYQTSLGTHLGFNNLIYMFSKILNFYETNNRLPSYVSVKPWSAVGSSSTSSGTATPIPSDLLKYIAATANCQVSNAQINELAWSLAQGSNGLDAATKIFNWVRDNIGYSFYYNTKYGAVGTLNAGTGNCVDTSHLLIALLRAAGIPARYEHVYARFSSGNWYGHVVAQVYVNGKWYIADATSSRNTFGVVNNWNTATATIKGTYASLPF